MNGKITEVEFANMLLTYSSFTTKKKETTLKRIKKTFARSSQVVFVEIIAVVASCVYISNELQKFIHSFFLKFLQFLIVHFKFN